MPSGRVVYVVMICDRRADPEPYVFSSANDAIEYARGWAQYNASPPDDFRELDAPEYLYCASYSPESDYVWVIEKEVR